MDNSSEKHYTRKDICDFIEMLNALGILKGNMVLITTMFDSLMDAYEGTLDG